MRLKKWDDQAESDRNRVNLPACGHGNISQIGRCRTRNEFERAQLALLRRLWLLRMVTRGRLGPVRTVAMLELTNSQTATARIECERQQENRELGVPPPHKTILHPLRPGLRTPMCVSASWNLLGLGGRAETGTAGRQWPALRQGGHAVST